jgi:dUTP pyrophosphatase
MKVKIKRLNGNTFIPQRGSEGAAGWDIYVPKNTVVRKGRQVIPVGLSLEVPESCYAAIEPRSGNESKGMEGILYHIWESNERADVEKRRFDCDVLRGIVDADYRGPIGVIVCNRDCEFVLPAGSKIAQIVLHRFESMEFETVIELSATKRADGGFGSTDETKA